MNSFIPWVGGKSKLLWMDDALKQLYEQTVPEAVREYLDSKAVPAPKPKRTAKSAAPKTPNSEPKAMAAVVKEGN